MSVSKPTLPVASVPPVTSPPVDAPVVAAPIAVEPRPPIRPLPAPRLRLLVASQSQSGNLWRATVPTETPPENPEFDEFWTGNADKLLVGDIIQVVPDDAAYFLTVYVYDSDSPGLGVRNKRVSVARIGFADMLKTRRVPQADEFKVESRGDFLKWCVVHIPSGRVIFEKCYDKGEGEEKLRAHLRSRDFVKKAA